MKYTDSYEIARVLKKRYKGTHLNVLNRVIQNALYVMVEYIAIYGKFTLQHFGTFEVKEMKPSQRYNLQTGRVEPTETEYRIIFKSSRYFKERVKEHQKKGLNDDE